MSSLLRCHLGKPFREHNRTDDFPAALPVYQFKGNTPAAQAAVCVVFIVLFPALFGDRMLLLLPRSQMSIKTHKQAIKNFSRAF